MTIKRIYNYIAVKVETLIEFFSNNTKKEPVLFCEETQRVLNFKLAQKKLEKNIVKFKLLKDRKSLSGSSNLTFDENRQVLHHIKPTHKK